MITDSLIRALVENNSVIVTGLGTFYVKKVPAQLIEDIAYPPHNIIELEYSKDIVGFAFVGKISEWNKITIDAAQEEIAKWTEMIEQGVENNKTVFFDDLGTFSKDILEKIVFQSVINSQVNFEFEGLEPVSVVFKTRGKQDVEETSIKDKRDILIVRKQKREKIWFITTVLAAAILLCVVFLKDTFMNYYKTIFLHDDKLVTENVIVENTATDIQMEEAIPVVTTTVVEEQIPVKEETSVKPKGIVKSQTFVNQKVIDDGEPVTMSTYKGRYLPYQEGNFYLIAGSFEQEDNALRHIKNRKLDSYNAKLVVAPDSPRVRVCIGIYDNMEEANSIAEYFNETYEQKYWVLK